MSEGARLVGGLKEEINHGHIKGMESCVTYHVHPSATGHSGDLRSGGRQSRQFVNVERVAALNVCVSI